MAGKTSPEEYQELGRRYYKLKQYEKAIEVLSQGIDTSPTLGLYDHRAATYDKLNEFNAAVKDGREMIKMDKKEVKGYLRTASVLEKMDKPETALGIYKYGMKNMPVDDQNFKLLQQLHDRLTRKLSPATAVDPFTVMPVELVEMILEYLSFRQMVNCMRVSRGWRDYLSKMPKLWMHLDLSGARRPVPRSFVATAVRRSASRLTRLTVHRFEHTDMLTRLAKACKSLAELEIISLPYTMATSLVEIAKCAPSLKKYVIHPEITLETAQQILQHRPDLHHVAFYKTMRPRGAIGDWSGTYSSLRSFTMNLTEHFNSAMPAILDKLPAVETLSLTNMYLCYPRTPVEADLILLPNLTSLSLTRVNGLFPSMVPIILVPTLQRLVIDLHFPKMISGRGLHAIKLPVLTHLSLTNIEDLSGHTMATFLDECFDSSGEIQQLADATPLQSITTHGTLSRYYIADGLFKGPESLFGQSRRILTTSLQALNVSTLPCDDDEIECLLGYETGIQTIDVSYTNITGASIKMLADRLPTLRTIHADNCPRINGRDAIAYAERKGISVSCLMNEGKGGRKIRYA
ncbi:hypothetical protein T440DRAFT_418564 [Plenodomus tracheiphilus IPT5]|uniref:F-box domain-containing protein n=1 Tax=Plenodomus tracheiphilus IPT5 TaxID=1408161 RepID=A0A6A7BDK2_9PLEO|nr:hypothetical protein T440DRAFT_418564 [Plenodomus tracheiphilus IPT5]